MLGYWAEEKFTVQIQGEIDDSIWKSGPHQNQCWVLNLSNHTSLNGLEQALPSKKPLLNKVGNIWELEMSICA